MKRTYGLTHVPCFYDILRKHDGDFSVCVYMGCTIEHIYKVFLIDYKIWCKSVHAQVGKNRVQSLVR